jgi:hypothetical protein
LNTKQRIFNINKYVLLTFIASIYLLLSGCATDRTLRSEVLAKSANNISNINVYYLERNLTSANSNTSANTALAKWGYFEIGPKLGEFGPLLFAKNNLTGQFTMSLDNNFVPAAASRVDTTQGILLLEFRNARVFSRGFIDHYASMMLNATLYNPKNNARIWSAQFNSHLGRDPALGVLKTTNVNQEYIDGMLTLVLEQMSKDQILVLPSGKVKK